MVHTEHEPNKARNGTATDHADANAWAAHADALAAWAWAHLANRSDVWGGYRALHERGKEYRTSSGVTAKLGQSTTRPAPSRRGKEYLTQAVLARHFDARGPEDVVGLHTTSAENRSRWGAPEIDWHGPCSTGPEINLRAALAWHRKLVGKGFRPLLTDSNGAGGYHLLALFAEPVPTPLVFAFLQWLVSDHTAHGLPNPPEVFPKQPRLSDGQVGNWLRVPGMHHTRPHWSKVWSGDRWLDGAEAAEFILALRGNSPSLIPADVEAFVRPTRVAMQGQQRAVVQVVSGDQLVARVSNYMAKLPNLGEGEGRDRVAFQFGGFLVRDLQLTDEQAVRWLTAWDAGNRPPKGEDRLREILRNVHRYGSRPYGQGLRERPQVTRRRVVRFHVKGV